jgi:Ca2+-binding RTX toxin-like protein
MTVVTAYNAAGTGLTLRSGTISPSSSLDVTYVEETVIDYNSSMFYVEYNYNLLSADIWVDFLFGSLTTARITDMYFYDTYNRSVVQFEDLNLTFDIYDDFSNGIIFSNMFTTNDRVTGNSFGDTVYLGAGNDVGRGLEGNDRFYGEGGRDRLYGDAGKDRLSGGSGTDLLTGGAGADTFVFSRGAGSDRITDFKDGSDRIEIATGAERFSDIDVSRSGADTVLTFSNVSVRLTNVDHTDISARDFIFV